MLSMFLTCCPAFILPKFVTRAPHNLAADGIACALRDDDDRDGTVEQDMSGSSSSHRLNRRRRYHSEHFDERSEIDIIVTEHVADYRAAVESLVKPNDVALEVGCAGGKTTDFLGRRACIAYGVDRSTSPGLLAEQRGRTRENTRFFAVDGSDIGELLKLSERAAQEARDALQQAEETRPLHAPDLPTGFSVILVDISGSAKLSAVLDLIERYETCFQPSLRLLVIKSFRWACLLDRTQLFERPAAASGSSGGGARGAGAGKE